MIIMTERLGNIGMGNSPSLLEMKNVTAVRSGKKILDSVSFSI